MRVCVFLFARSLDIRLPFLRPPPQQGHHIFCHWWWPDANVHPYIVGKCAHSTGWHNICSAHLDKFPCHRLGRAPAHQRQNDNWNRSSCKSLIHLTPTKFVSGNKQKSDAMQLLWLCQASCLLLVRICICSFFEITSRARNAPDGGWSIYQRSLNLHKR